MHGIYRLLDNNARYVVSDRINDPSEFINYLKTQPRFRTGILDLLPKHAIILHDARPEEFLTHLGYSATGETLVLTGMTDPNLMYIVYEKPGTVSFLLNRGLPGCGG